MEAAPAAVAEEVAVPVTLVAKDVETPVIMPGPGGESLWQRKAAPFKLLFHHLSPLVAAGYARRLEPEDLYLAEELQIEKVRARRGSGAAAGGRGSRSRALHCASSRPPSPSQLSAEFEEDWNHQLTLKNPTLWGALKRGSGRVRCTASSPRLASAHPPPLRPRCS